MQGFDMRFQTLFLKIFQPFPDNCACLLQIVLINYENPVKRLVAQSLQYNLGLQNGDEDVAQ